MVRSDNISDLRYEASEQQQLNASAKCYSGDGFTGHINIKIVISAQTGNQKSFKG